MFLPSRNQQKKLKLGYCVLQQNVVVNTIAIAEVVVLSHIKTLFPSSQQQNISLEQAIAKILDASIEDISAALRQASPEETAKLLIAVGKAWEDEEET